METGTQTATEIELLAGPGKLFAITLGGGVPSYVIANSMVEAIEKAQAYHAPHYSNKSDLKCEEAHGVSTNEVLR